jgi:dTDP-4-dehydrorhamnose reductase
VNQSGITLVVGGDGIIGQALVGQAQQAGQAVIATTRQRDSVSPQRWFLDMAAAPEDWTWPEGVAVAYLCAGVTALEQCRTRPQASFHINVTQTVALAERLVDAGAFVIFPSTNLVFDGSVPFTPADAPPAPCTAYGRQKAETERRLLALGAAVAVVRPTKIVQPGMPRLLEWARALGAGEPVHPFSDMVLAPIPLSSVLQVFHQIARLRLSGILQLSAAQDISYAQVAAHIAHRLGADPALVQPVLCAESGLQLECVPAHTTLDASRVQQEIGLEPPDVWTTIDLVWQDKQNEELDL